MPPQTGTLPCEHCGEVFQRKEHRDRHLLRHSGLKPFHCRSCSRAFPRRDSLVRHRITHHSHGVSPGHPRRALQACVRCSRLKQRCDGRQPCARCARQNGPCEYRQGVPPTGVGALARPPDFVGHAVNDAAPVEGPRRRGADGESAGRTRTFGREPSSMESNSTFPSRSSREMSWEPGSEVAHIYIPSSPDLSGVSPVANLPVSPTIYGTAWGLDDWLGTQEFSMLDLVDPKTTGFPFLSSTAELETLDPYLADNEVIGQASHSCRPQELAPTPGGTRGQPQDSLQSQEKRIGSNLHHPWTHPHGSIVFPTSRRQPCPEFPAASPDQYRTAEAELFGHIASIPDRCVEAVRLFYGQQRECDSSRFIGVKILHAFVELYLEYFDPGFPFLHRSRLAAGELSWVLLIAIAAVGSQYSEIPCASKYGVVLQDLLGRAIGDHITPRSKWADTSLVQSLFLRHVLLFSSGTKVGHLILQFEKSALVSTLRASASLDEPRHHVTHEDNKDPYSEWQSWLLAEEKVRLLHCVRALECLQLVFLDKPPSFDLADFFLEIPCNDVAWKCQNAEEWRKVPLNTTFRRANSASARSQSRDPAVCNTHGECYPGLDEVSSQAGRFFRRMSVLELYVDDRLRSRQLRSSRVLHSLFASKGCRYEESDGHMLTPSMPTAPERSSNGGSVVDNAIDTEAYAQLDSRHGADMVVHALAILRKIPIATLYRATGWQTDEAGMAISKSHVERFLCHDAAAARKCLWHATTIFTKLRKARSFACYDTLNFCVAVCYIWSYAHLSPETQRRVQTPGDTPPATPLRAAVRLDKFARKQDVEMWIESGGDVEIHVTGLGHLSGPNCRLILLRDAAKTLTNQPAWPSVCQGLARAFAQVEHGELPDMDSE